MSMIKYGFGEIEAAAGDIQSTSGRINALLDGLKSQIRPMVSTWEGESAVPTRRRKRSGIKQPLSSTPFWRRSRRPFAPATTE